MPVMPVIQKQKAKIEDVEAISHINESFDYSLDDPLVDVADEIYPDESQTGLKSNKNSMI